MEAEPLSVQFFRTCEIEGPPRIARFNAMHARLPHFARALSENFDANFDSLSPSSPQRCGGGSGPTFFFFLLLHCRQEIVGSCGLLGFITAFFFSLRAQPRARMPLAKRAKVDVSSAFHLGFFLYALSHALPPPSTVHPYPALIAPIAHPRAPQDTPSSLLDRPALVWAWPPSRIHRCPPPLSGNRR